MGLCKANRLQQFLAQYQRHTLTPEVNLRQTKSLLMSQFRDHFRERPNYFHPKYVPGGIGTSTHAIAVGGLHPRVGVHGLIHWFSFQFHAQCIELNGRSYTFCNTKSYKGGSGRGHSNMVVRLRAYCQQQALYPWTSLRKPQDPQCIESQGKPV